MKEASYTALGVIFRKLQASIHQAGVRVAFEVLLVFPFRSFAIGVGIGGTHAFPFDNRVGARRGQELTIAGTLHDIDQSCDATTNIKK